jgi:hypothetical protein
MVLLIFMIDIINHWNSPVGLTSGLIIKELRQRMNHGDILTEFQLVPSSFSLKFLMGPNGPIRVGCV